ncbi:MAG: MFS transporter [Verrucomicrobia bacterium]|nr:MFS transporter [Verrucomicrobiota bacterium]
MNKTAQSAFRFVLVLGIANLFADMTYEGARSVTGPFLGSLGANAAVIGFTAGFGELIGHGLRSLSGLISDRTGKYWIATITGYCINMLAVPALALAGNWPLAAGLVVAERTGRAIRKPSTDAMLSFAGKQIGHGWVFGLNEALDQAGATIGPLLISLNLFQHRSYQHGFAILLLPALVTIAIICAARHFFPHPHQLEAGVEIHPTGLPLSYWLYVAAGAFVAAGFADFSLIAYHFQHSGTIRVELIPVLYAVAMLMGSIGALVFGKLLDRMGPRVLFVAIILGALFAPLVFFGGITTAAIGVVVWGIGLAAQGSSLRAVLSTIISRNKRGTGFGVFDMVFGIAWFIGSWIMGLLYDHSLFTLVVFSVVMQLLALPLFFLARARTQATT